MPTPSDHIARAAPARPVHAPAEDPAEAKGFNKATGHILRVLSEFAQQPHGALRVTELSQRLGLTKNMVFRALATLTEQGYVTRDAQGSRYVLGYRVFELCTAEFEPPDLRALCAPFLRRLHELTHETVLLSIGVGDHSVVIDGIEGRGPLLSRVTHGHAIPLHAGPGSRAILAFLPDGEVRRYIDTHLPLHRFTATTIVDEAALWSEIEAVRARGYAIGYRDHLTGVYGVAFPIFDADHRVQGAISVGGPEDQINEDTVAPLLPAIRRIVDEANQRSRLVHFGYDAEGTP